MSQDKLSQEATTCEQELMRAQAAAKCECGLFRELPNHQKDRVWAKNRVRVGRKIEKSCILPLVPWLCVCIQKDLLLVGKGEQVLLNIMMIVS